MGSQLPAGGQGGLTPETLAALQQMGGMQAMPSPQPQVQPPAVPLPNIQPSPAPAAQPGGIAGVLSGLWNYFMGGTSAKDLAAPQQGGALTPEELQRRRRLMSGQQ